MAWWNSPDFADHWSSNWDSEEQTEDLSQPQSPMFTFATNICNSSSVKLGTSQSWEVDLLVVGCGLGACAFLEAQFQKKKLPVATMFLPGVSLANVSIQQSLMDPVITVYKLQDTEQTVIGLVQCQVDVATEQTYSFVKTIFEHIKSHKVIVLDTIKPHILRSVLPSDDIISPLVRCLRTDYVPLTLLPPCPYLESPIMIDKLSAAFLTRCQIYKVPAFLLVSLDESGVGRVGGGEQSGGNPSTLYAFEKALRSLIPTNNTNSSSSSNSSNSSEGTSDINSFVKFGGLVKPNMGDSYTAVLGSVKSNPGKGYSCNTIFL